MFHFQSYVLYVFPAESESKIFKDNGSLLIANLITGAVVIVLKMSDRYPSFKQNHFLITSSDGEQRPPQIVSRFQYKSQSSA